MQHARVSPTVRGVNKSITQPRTWIVGKWSTTHKGQQFVPGSHHLFAINIYPRNTLRGSSGFPLTKVSLRLDNINDGRIVVSRRNEEFLFGDPGEVFAIEKLFENFGMGQRC